MKRILFFICTVFLVFNILTPFASAHTEEGVVQNELAHEFLGENSLEFETKLLEVDKKLEEYIDKIPYTEEEFEGLSEFEQDRFIKEYFSTDEYMAIQQEYQNELSNPLNPEVQYALPLVVPIAMIVGREALKLVAKKGVSFAKSYLKPHIQKLGKNYDVAWDVKGRNHELNSLVVVFQKANGKRIGRVFAVDHGPIPLKPGSKQSIWHFHIAPDTGMHRTLKEFIPSGHKPDTRTVAY